MHSSKRKTYERLYKIAKRKLDKTRENKDDSDSDDGIPKRRHLLTFPTAVKETASALETNEQVHIETHRDIPDQPLSEDETSTSELYAFQNDYSSGSDEESLSIELSEWVTKFNISHNASDALLKVLNLNGHANLPVTTRSLLNSRSAIKTQLKSGMEYYYFGVKKQLIEYITMALSASKDVPSEIQLSLNIDGLPLFRSSKK